LLCRRLASRAIFVTIVLPCTPCLIGAIVIRVFAVSHEVDITFVGVVFFRGWVYFKRILCRKKSFYEAYKVGLLIVLLFFYLSVKFEDYDTTLAIFLCQIFELMLNYQCKLKRVGIVQSHWNNPRNKIHIR